LILSPFAFGFSCSDLHRSVLNESLADHVVDRRFHERCADRFSRPQLKIPHGCPLGLRPSQKADEFLPVDVKAETGAIPAEKGAEDFVKF
jgi:hypothetical protein